MGKKKALIFAAVAAKINANNFLLTLERGRVMPKLYDGPVSACFRPVWLQSGLCFEDLSSGMGISDGMAKAAEHAPRGQGSAWGIPFTINDIVLVKDAPVALLVEPFQAGWLVFLHTADPRPLKPGPGGIISPMPGAGHLNDHAADYVVVFDNGSEARIPIKRRHQVGDFTRGWGENCFEAVAAHKPHTLRAAHEQLRGGWGWTQARVDTRDHADWMNWIFAWQNPSPELSIVGLRFEPVAPHANALVISAVSAGTFTGSQSGQDQTPLRWNTRRKAVLRLPEGTKFNPQLDEEGLLAQIQLDLGQVISARPRLIYPNQTWESTYNNQLPRVSETEWVVEYTAHPQARFHLWDGSTISTAQIESGAAQGGALEAAAPAVRRVTMKVIERGTGKRVAVKLHVHGEVGEYLAPLDRHRFVNSAWFEDYSADFSHLDQHSCSYITGETVIDLPLGRVYVEVSKGFEIRPVRKVLEIGPDTQEVTIELERVLPWREHGWVTADTHVHFLSPATAMLEGAGEGVNVVNLLASQWGELMTNVGDFDGRTTWGAGESGGPEANGEYLVRVGTENRQHVLGHISLLGYQGGIIAPMTTGGPDESALGDPIESLLTEWARQCKQQGGLVVLPHFPNPRAEHAASIVSGEIDAVEMTSWEDLYYGISPYSLSDWYRYLNCGYRVAAVGGTDKMTAITAVGTVRTYARIPFGQPFSYAAWMEAVRRSETFASYGPLLEFSVDGQPMGAQIQLSRSGGTLDVAWQVASVTMPISKVELVINGEIRESAPVSAEGGMGSWSVRVEKSCWLALLVRGHYADKPEIITAHSSPVYVAVEGSELMAAADAVTILDQIEGALAYLDTVGTRAEDRVYKRMRLVLEAAHRSLHNRMHQQGQFHEHNPVADHHQS